MKPFAAMTTLSLILAPALWASEPPADGTPEHVELPVDSAELQAIVDGDQADRTSGALLREPEEVVERDRQRRERTLALLRADRLSTARDYFNAALVFQHSADDVELAYALATVSHYLDPTRKASTSLMAAAWDRMLMQRVQPQWYGTQYQSNERGTFLYPIAEGVVTDAERETMGVPTLAQARARLAEMAASVGRKAQPTPEIETLRANARATATGPQAEAEDGEK